MEPNISTPAPTDREVPNVAARINTVVEGDSSDGASNATATASMRKPDTAADAAPPQRVGRYRIEKMHAAGGMGRVWNAFDEVLQRSVALKDVRPDVLQADVRRRFLDEAKITARLEHPGIIPVYDMPAGDDAPCYVMRFVRGKTFAKAMGEYHHKRQGGTASAEFFRLVQAFHSICQTVAYAHAQNVLHRDLKPANVLLGDFGEVLVLDWGLAKGETLAEGAAASAERSVTETQAGQIMGTPAYMSPEQSEGDSKALTPRSDVWSLGAILYELLAGQLPFYGDTVADTLRKVRDETPKSPRSVNPTAQRGLEAVCLKAIAKSPSHRYASAQELAEDVARWLADEPVHAHAEPWWQRLARWSRRHKAVVASASAILISAVIALSLSTFFIGQQRSRAEANLRTALDVVDSFFLTVSENRLLNEPGMQPLRAELLRSAVAFSEKFAEENGGDQDRQVDLAKVKLLLGRVLSQLDEPKQSLAALEQAREMYAKLRRANPADIALWRGEALATLNLGVRVNESDPARAEREFRDAIAQYERLKEKAPALEEAREKFAHASNNLAMLNKSQGQFGDAQSRFEKAIAIMAELVAAAPKNAAYPEALAGFHSNLADVWMQKKNLVEARKHAEASVALRQGLVNQGVKDLNLEDSLAASKNLLGYLAMLENKWADAEARFREAIRLREALVRRNPGVPRLKSRLAWAHYSLGKSLERQTRYADAIAEVGLCIEILEQMADEAPTDAVVQADLGKANLTLGYYCYDSKNLVAAELAFTKSLDRLGKLGDALPKSSAKDLLDAHWTRAMVRADQGRFAESVADYDRAIQLDPGPQRAALTKERDAVARKATK